MSNSNGHSLMALTPVKFPTVFIMMLDWGGEKLKWLGFPYLQLTRVRGGGKGGKGGFPKTCFDDHHISEGGNKFSELKKIILAIFIFILKW